MPKPGPKTTTRYSDEFKATAVRLSELPGVRVQDVAASLYIHPFMLSRWRKWAREGRIMTKGVAVDQAVTAELGLPRRCSLVRLVATKRLVAVGQWLTSCPSEREQPRAA